MANCLYNGEDLPNVNSVYTPDVQKDFPFLVMFKLGITRRRFARACSSRPYYNGSAVIADGAYLASGCNLDDDTPSWVAWEEGENLSQSGVFWTNTDILNEDGTLYLAASDPIPVSAPQHDPLSLFMGWKAGNWVARQRGKKKPATGVYDDTMPIEWKMQDVANNFRIPAETFQIYSYNGYEFGAPAIDADSDCKYHIIHKYENGYYYTCTNKPFMYTEDNNKYAEIKESLKRIVYVCSGDDIGFVHNDDLADSGLRVLWDNIIWTNTDISDADGTVRMAATEPVYVREQVAQELIKVIKVSNYIPTDEMVNNHAISIQSDGDEVVLSSPYAAPLDDEGNIVVVLFLDVVVGLAVFMYYFKQECIFEGQAFEPGLYYADSIPSMYPPDTKFKFYIPDET